MVVNLERQQTSVSGLAQLVVTLKDWDVGNCEQEIDYLYRGVEKIAGFSGPYMQYPDPMLELPAGHLPLMEAPVILFDTNGLQWLLSIRLEYFGHSCVDGT